MLVRVGGPIDLAHPPLHIQEGSPGRVQDHFGRGGVTAVTVRGEQANDEVATAVNGHVACLWWDDEGGSERATHDHSVVFTVGLEVDDVVCLPGVGKLLAVSAVDLVGRGVLKVI